MLGRLCLTVALLALTLTASARADVLVYGPGEPAFTNSANNTQWVEWSSTSNYRVEFQHKVDGATVYVDGPFSMPKTAAMSVNWSGIPGVSVPLQEGRTYGVCAQGRWDDGSGMYFPDLLTSCASGKRTATTIDRTKPTITLTAPAFTREPSAPITIGYEDALAYPYGVAFVSVDAPQLQILPGCAPATPTRVTTFRCSVNLPAADGPHQVCAVVPDAAIPDNPHSWDQSGTAVQANQSDPKCTTVTVDRAAPQLALSGPSELTVGQVGHFTVQATDATSGVAEAPAWQWGDGSAGAGYDASHTFANPGSYRVRLTAKDAAGNAAEVAKDVKVVAAPVKDTPTTPSTPVTATPTAPAPAPVVGAPAPPVEAKLAVSSVKVRKRVLRANVSGATGSVRLTLRRGRTIVASKLVPVKGGAVALTLPRTLVAGKHVLEVRAGSRIAGASVKLAGKRPGAKGSRLDPTGQRPKLP